MDLPTPEEIRRMTPEGKRESLERLRTQLRELAGPSVEVFVPRTFALAIDVADEEPGATVRPSEVVGIGIESDIDALVRVRNPYTRRTDNLLFASAECARRELGTMGDGPLRLFWGQPIIPVDGAQLPV